jgi:Superinfection immunity protein
VDAAFLGFIILVGLISYFIPTIVARVRKTPRPVAIFLVNLVFGWTVLGWIAALVWAVGQRQLRERETADSFPVESDGWFLDPPKLNDRNAAEQVDHWILGPENILEPRNR